MKYLIFAITPWLFISCFPSEPPCCLEWTEEEYIIENTDEESVEVEQYEHGEHFSVEIKNFYTGMRRGGFVDIIFADKNGNIFYSKSKDKNQTAKYLIKLNSQEELLWEKQIISAQSDINTYSYSIIDNSDTIVVAGGFPLNLFFTNILENGNKATDNIWSTGEANYGYISSVVTDSKENIYISGIMTNTDSWLSDGFVGKWDKNSNLLWMKQSGKKYSDNVSSIVIDKYDNLYLTGTENINGEYFSNIANLGTNMFIAKWDSDGKEIWKKISRNEKEIFYGTSLAILEENVIFLGQRCTDIEVIAEIPDDVETPDDDQIMEHHCYINPFLRKYDPEGNKIWEKRWRGKKNKISETTAVSVKVIDNTIYTVLNAWNQIGGDPDIMITAFNKDGDFILSQIFESDCQDYPSEILPMPNNKLMLTGQTSGWIGNDLSTAECEGDTFIPFALILEPLNP